MDPADTRRAIAVTTSIARSLGLQAEQADVIQSSNKLSLRLRPADVFARVAPSDLQHARFEIPLAQRLVDAGCPVAAPDPRVEARGYVRNGFEVTFWTYLEPVAPTTPPAAYLDALHRLHLGMRQVDVAAPRFTDRVAEAERIVTSADRSPCLGAADRELLVRALHRTTAAILARAPDEQLLHGEPHPGNVLNTAEGPRFVDLETCCRGPVEFDLAHTPVAVADDDPGIDRTLLADCRALVLAMVAAWRFDPGDQLPDGERFGRALIAALRTGPPWPTPNTVFDGLA